MGEVVPIEVMSKPFEPTREHRKTVEAMLGFGIPPDEIARANMADYVKSTPQGDPYFDFSALSRDHTGAAAFWPAPAACRSSNRDSRRPARQTRAQRSP